jgi:homoserine kinase
MRVRVRVPASTANLGPGFDALGIALDLWNSIEIETGGSEIAVEYAGTGATGMDGQENYSLRAMRLLADEHGRALPPFRLTAMIEVPVARGLGSSAAAIVTGMVAANRLLDLGLDDDAIFRASARMEGHGDNVGAALYGGAILSVPGLGRAIRLGNAADLGLVAVVFIPEEHGATWVARAELPQHVTLADAAFNVGAASGIVAGMLTGDLDAIAAGMHDRLHEPPRSRLYPHLMPMAEAARAAGAIGACLSGAGPAVLALTRQDRADAVARAMAAVANQTGVIGQAQTLQIAATGAEIICHDDALTASG